MPRHIDPELEGRILNAARRLWHKGGETALSMRAVAKAAGTNTPAVYRRFSTREEILRVLVRSYQRQLYQELAPCGSLTETAEAFLNFALRQPREYELIMSGLLARVTEERPNFELLAVRCAEWFGGRIMDYEALVMAIASLAHGTAMLTISGTLRKKDVPTARAAMLRALDALIANREKFRQL